MARQMAANPRRQLVSDGWRPTKTRRGGSPGSTSEYGYVRKLSQYSGIHDFVAELSIPNAPANSVGDLPLERFNVAPTNQVASTRAPAPHKKIDR